MHQQCSIAYDNAQDFFSRGNKKPRRSGADGEASGITLGISSQIGVGHSSGPFHVQGPAGRIQMGQGRPFGRRLTFPVFGSVIVIRKIRIHPGRSSGGFNGQAIGHLHYWTCIKEVDALHLPCKSWVQGTRFTRVVFHRCYDGQGSYPLAVFTLRPLVHVPNLG